MTIYVPKWLVWTVVGAIVVAGVVAAFLLGRSSGGEGGPAAAVSTPPRDRAVERVAAGCSKPMAEKATLRSGFDDAIRNAGVVAAKLAGDEPSKGPGFFTNNPIEYQIAVLRCRDLTGDGNDEMIVGIGAGAAGRVFQWAIFTPDEEGGWKLAFDREGGQVSDIGIRDDSVVARVPIYGPTDALCCPSGHRSIRVAYSNGRLRVVSPAASPRSREIVVAEDGSVTRLGRFQPPRDSSVQARSYFGTPTGVEDESDVCRLSWADLGLSITFANLGGRDACGPDGRVASFDLSGTPAAQAGWRTAEGARVGMSISVLLDLYPGATRMDGELVLAEKSSPIGEAGKIAVMTGYSIDGRVLAFHFYVGAAGE